MLKFSQILQRLTGHTEHGPLVHRDGAQLFIESDCRFVPVENGPFESAALALARDPGKFNKHGATVSPAPHFRNDEQVFKVQTGPAQERREVVEEDGEAFGAVVEFGVRFYAPVVVPDDDVGAAIEVSGTVEEKLDGSRVVLGLTARSGEAKVLTRARAVVRLP